MPGSYTITFLPEGRVKEFWGSDGNWYSLDDGTRLKVETCPVWCARCKCIGEGEQVETLAEIDRQLADLRDPNSLAYRIFRRVRRHLIEEGERRRAWRERRTSPAKCIACGSTEIVVFPMNRAIPNPAGPGTLEVRCVGLCRVSPTNWSFTPEGDRLPGKASAK